MNTIICFVAPQGAGKSKLALFFLNKTNTLLLSQDKIRYATLDYPRSSLNFHKKIEKDINKLALKSLKILAKKQPVIYDEILFLHRLKKILKFSKNIAPIFININLKKALENNKKRKTGHVPPHAIKRDFSKLKKQHKKIIKTLSKHKIPYYKIDAEFSERAADLLLRKIIRNHPDLRVK